MNNFIANTTVFFNTFAENIEEKISKVSNKITEVEILLAVLEAKLNSVPGLDNIEPAQPPPQASSTTEPSSFSGTNSNSQNNTANSSSTAAAPSSGTSAAAASAPAEKGPEEEPPAAVPAAPSLADDPDYGPFCRLLKVGVPMFVVQAKAAAAGLDASRFDSFVV